MTDLKIQDYRTRVTAIEEMLVAGGSLTGKASEKLCPLRHSFAHGFYIRELECPAGVIAVTKIHKTAHPFILMEGEVSILTEDGVQRLKAPQVGITKAGTKRVVFTHAHTKWATVHDVGDETNLDKIEELVIAKDFAELEDLESLAELMGVT